MHKQGIVRTLKNVVHFFCAGFCVKVAHEILLNFSALKKSGDDFFRERW